MSGTFLNIVSIIAGSLIGVLIGDRLSAKMQESIMGGLGLVTLFIGMQNTFRTGNILIPLLGLLIGTIIGELLDLDAALKRFGGWLQSMVQRNTATAESNAQGAANALPDARVRFINGFVTASLVFCIGPLAILGSVQNGMNGADIKLLAIKSTLDFFGSIAFAASLGIGVAFSTLPTLVIQGGFSLLGVALISVLAAGGVPLDNDNPYIREVTATGGLLLMGLALLLLNIKQLRVANFLPALIIVPMLILLAALLHITIYPSLS